MRISSLLILLVFLAVSLDAHAEDTGDRYTHFAGFELGALNLAAVQAKLAPATLVETGDAGEYAASICYSVNNGVVLFLAGEMDGPKHDLGAFGLARATDRQPCSKWPAHKPQPNLQINSLRLGMSEREFIKKVGGKIHKEGGRVYSSFESRRKMTAREIQALPKDFQETIRSGQQQGWYDVVVFVVATFKADELSHVEVWKSETY